MAELRIVTEDVLGLVLLRKTLALYAPRIRTIDDVRGGKTEIKSKIVNYNRASKYQPFCVLVDLNGEYRCPTELVTDWLPHGKEDTLLLRLAVREVESWIMADSSAFSSYVAVSEKLIERPTDQIEHPKEFLINVVRKKCRKREIKDQIIPVGYSKIGRGYNVCLARFIYSHWNAERARRHSPSLDRSIERIVSFCNTL